MIAKISVYLNASSEMKTIKYLSFIPETRDDVVDKSLPVECHTSTCGNRQETTNIRTQDTLKSAALCMVFVWCFYLTHVRALHACRSEMIAEIL